MCIRYRRTPYHTHLTCKEQNDLARHLHVQNDVVDEPLTCKYQNDWAKHLHVQDDVVAVEDQVASEVVHPARLEACQKSEGRRQALRMHDEPPQHAAAAGAGRDHEHRHLAPLHLPALLSRTTNSFEITHPARKTATSPVTGMWACMRARQQSLLDMLACYLIKSGELIKFNDKVSITRPRCILQTLWRIPQHLMIRL